MRLIGAGLVWMVAGLAALAQDARVGLVNPGAVVSAGGKVFAVDTDANAVVVSEGAKEQRVSVGRGPVSLTVDGQRGLVWVANAGDGSLSLIDARDARVKGTVEVGRNPYSVAVDAAVGRVYVTHTFNDSLTIVDEQTRAVRQVKGLEADLLAVNEKAGRVYLLGYEGGELRTLDVDGRVLGKASAGMHAWGMAVDAATGAVFVGRVQDAEVAEFDVEGKVVRHVRVGAIPSAVAVDSKTGRVFVACYGEDDVAVVDATHGVLLKRVKVGRRPEGIAVDEVRGRVAVANARDGEGSVTVVDGGKMAVVETMRVVGFPHAVGFDGDGKVHVAAVGMVR